MKKPEQVIKVKRSIRLDTATSDTSLKDFRAKLQVAKKILLEGIRSEVPSHYFNRLEIKDPNIGLAIHNDSFDFDSAIEVTTEVEFPNDNYDQEMVQYKAFVAEQEKKRQEYEHRCKLEEVEREARKKQKDDYSLLRLARRTESILNDASLSDEQKIEKLKILQESRRRNHRNRTR